MTSNFTPPGVSAALIAIELSTALPGETIRIHGLERGGVPEAVQAALTAVQEFQHDPSRPLVLPVYARSSAGKSSAAGRLEVDPERVEFRWNPGSPPATYAVVLFVDEQPDLEPHEFDQLVLDVLSQIDDIAAARGEWISRRFVAITTPAGIPA